MKLMTKHLTEIILAVVAIMLVVGIVLVLATPIGNFFTGVLDKEKEPVNDNIFQTGTYDIPFTVSLKKNIAEAGTVEFTGEHSGTSANLSAAGTVTFKATVNSGYKFLGWYQGDTLISNSLEYTTGYNVSGGTVITAKYKVGMAAGLYETGTTTMLMSWDELIDNGILSSTGKIVSGQEANLAGDLVISDSVTKIYGSAYKNCTALTGVIIPDSVTTISGSAFYSCTALTGVVIPDSVTSIGTKLFQNCTTLESVTFGENSQLSTISDNAFYGCTSLESITIPDSVETIGIYAFFECTSLTSVGPVGSGASVEIPSGVTIISNDIFRDCTNLTSIIIPDTVTSIGERAFQDCTRFTSITIPDSVTSIGARAFTRCTKLANINVQANTPPTINKTTSDQGTFYGCSALKTITVPAGTLSAYQTAWSSVASKLVEASS